MLSLLVAALISSSVPEGTVMPVWQWCDTLEDAKDVVTVHQQMGQEAASQVFQVKVEQNKCHYIPPQLATEGLLVNPETQDMLQFQGVDTPYMVEIWLGIVNGAGKDHGYIFIMYPVITSQPEPDEQHST